MIRYFSMALSALAMAQAAALADFTLVKDGKADCTLIVSAQTNAWSWFAVGELREHVKLVTGVELPIVQDDVEVKGARIFIGPSKTLDALGVTTTELKEQEYMIRFLPNDTLAIVGRDDWDANTVPDGPPSSKLPGSIHSSQGTLYGVYDFLERYCDVHWYAPGTLGVVYPETNTLSVKRIDLQRKPKLDCRRGHSWPYAGLVGQIENDGDAMARFHRRNKFGGRWDSTSHSFEKYAARFYSKHDDSPDIWEGEHHEFFPPDGNLAQLCYSSAATVSQVVSDARAAFNGHAPAGAVMGQDCFAVVPLDNGTWCCCEECQRQLEPDKKNGQFSNGYASKYIWGFTVKVANEIAKTHPGKFIGQLAYGDCAEYPEGMELPANIRIGVCLGTRTWIARERHPEYAFYKSWVEKAPGRLTPCWLYQCFPDEYAETGGYKCYPGFHASLLAWEFRMFGDDGMSGVDLCGTAAYIDGWLTIKMMDDPYLDAIAALHEFFMRFYGPAGNAMERAYWIIEDGYTNPDNYPAGEAGGVSQEISWSYLGTTERMASIQAAVDDAKVMAKTEKEKKRVAAFDEHIWQVMSTAKSDWDFKAPYIKEVEAMKAAPPPQITIRRIERVKDGDPRHVQWDGIETHLINRANSGYPSSTRTADLAMAHDGENFYIHLYEHGDAVELEKGYTAWFMGHRWELFYGNSRIGNQNEHPTYRQIGLHVGGKLDIWREDELYKGVAYYESHDRKGWDMKVVIPLKQLTDDGVIPGGSFYMNFIRGANDASTTLALSPIFQTMYHCPERFAEFTLAK